MDNLFDVLNIVRGLILLAAFGFVYYFGRDFFSYGFRLIDKEKYEKAMEVLRSRIKKNPNKGNLYLGLGFCYFMLGYFNHAYNYFHEALAKGCKADRLYCYLIMALLEIDPKARNVQVYIEQAGELDQDMVAWIHFMRGQHRDAMTIVQRFHRQWQEKLRKHSSGNAPAFYRLAMLLKLNQQQEEALKYFNETISSAPKSIFAQFGQKEIEKMDKVDLQNGD
jgi:tetratricopeptide (TPR) repeat protein